MASGGFLAVAALLLGFGLLSGRLERGPITAPMAFLGFGWALGPEAFGLVELDLGSDAVLVVFELTLVLVLFTDASRIDLRALGRRFAAPLRLLGIGMPLTIAAGTAAGAALLGGLSVAEALVLAVVLAPTDAALGAAVVTSRHLPVTVRQTINVESGLNDGLAVPVLTVAVAIAAASADPGSAPEWVGFAVREIGVAVAVGVAVGWGGAALVDAAHRRDWIAPVFQRLAALSLSLIAFSGAELLEGSGFIAAFVAGAAAGSLVRSVCTPLFEFAEAEGQLLTLVAFLTFGAVAVGPALEAVTWERALYVGLSLTVVRMVPVALALLGSGLRVETVAFLGWFGPRGVASIVFALTVLGEEGLGGASVEIFDVAALAVTVSTVLHGATAAAWARGYGRRVAHAPDDMGPAPDLPMRMAGT